MSFEGGRVWLEAALYNLSSQLLSLLNHWSIGYGIIYLLVNLAKFITDIVSLTFIETPEYLCDNRTPGTFSPGDSSSDDSYTKLDA